MAIIFKPRKSTLAGAVPTTSQLQDGEMAVNTTDKKIFIRVGAAIVEMFKSLTKADVGLSNVDNTSDVNKPVSTATATALAAKANTSHTHAIADVSGLQSALDGKQPSGSYAPSSHSHSISNVTGLQTALDGSAKLSGGNSLTGSQVINNARLLVKGDTGEAVRIMTASGQTYIDGVSVDQSLFAPLRFRATNVDIQGPTYVNGNLTSGSTIAGTFVAVDGPAPGSQQAHLALRRGGYVNWQLGTEGNGSLSLWSYNDTGGYMMRALGMDRDGSVAVSNISTLTANSGSYMRVPRTFIQPGDPGAAASDGDLWIW